MIYIKQLFLLKTLCANFENQGNRLILWFQLTISNKGSKRETDLVGKRFSIPCQNPLEPSLMSSISLLQLSSKSHVHLHQPLLVSCCMLVDPWIAEIGSLASPHLQAQTITLFRGSKTVCSPYLMVLTYIRLFKFYPKSAYVSLLTTYHSKQMSLYLDMQSATLAMCMSAGLNWSEPKMFVNHPQEHHLPWTL